MKELKQIEKILSNHLEKLYVLMYREKFDLEDPSEEEKWIISQYKIIQLLDNALKEVIKNEKSSKQNGK